MEKAEFEIGELLHSKKLTLAVAESCSGGLLAHRLTNIPGSSVYFLMGIVSYSNEAKEKVLGIESRILKENGAVSEVVAIEMAKKVRGMAASDLGVGITGIAGPGGGTKEKPVGLVFIAVDYHNRLFVTKKIFRGEREDNKIQTTDCALKLIKQVIK